MKQDIPPAVITVVVVVVVLLVGLWFYWGSRPAGSKEEVDKVIAGSAMKITPGARLGPAGAPAAPPAAK